MSDLSPSAVEIALDRMARKHADPEQLAPDARLATEFWPPILDWATSHRLIRSLPDFYEAYLAPGPLGAYHHGFVEIVVHSLLQWCRDYWQLGRYSCNWLQLGWSRPNTERQQIEFSFPEIDLTCETEGAAEERFMQAARAEFQKLLTEATERARKWGILAPQRVEPAHFVWLAQFQVLGWSKETIRKKADMAWGAVHNGIQRAAELLVGETRLWLRTEA